MTVITDATAAATPEIHNGKNPSFTLGICLCGLLTFVGILNICFVLRSFSEKGTNIVVTSFGSANILDMKNIGVKTPTLHEWSEELA